MNNGDRGRIKWSSLMLPEHKEMLKDLYGKQVFVDKPQLTEDKYAEINYIITKSLPDKEYMIRVYNNSLCIIKGFIIKVDKIHGKITIKVGDRVHIINRDDIIDINW